MRRRDVVIKSLIVILCMLFQNISILATNEVQSYYPQLTMPSRELDIPSEVTNVDSYIEIPVYNNGDMVEQVTVHLNKQTNQGKIYDGDASLKVKGYAYKNKGASDVILGLAIGYYGYEDPNNPIGTPKWYDQFIEAVKVGGSQTSATVEECKALMRNSNYSIRIDSIGYQDQMQDPPQELTQDARVLPIVESYKDNVLIGTWRNRPTEKHVALATFENIQQGSITRAVIPVQGEKNQWDVKVQMTKNKTIDTVIVLDVPNSNEAQGICKNTLDNVLNPLLKEPGSKVSLVLEGKEIENYLGPTSIDEKTLSTLVKDKIKENNKTNADLFNANSIQKAREILASNNSSNKSIVVVSYEGANCKGKSNGNSGKGDCVELTQSNKEAIITQMKSASDEGITIHTFAAHGMKGENKEHISPLQQLLSENTNGKFYATEFAQTSLKADSQVYMTEIATLINTKQNVGVDNTATHLVYTDKLNSQFKIISSNLPDTTINETNTEITWNIGDLKQDQEKTLTYRIEMIEGNIGTLYLLSKEVKLNYINQAEQSVSISNIFNPFLKSAWAKVTINGKDDMGMVLTKEDNTPYSTGIWLDVKDAIEGDAININLSNPIDPNTMELKNSGTSTVADFIAIPQYQCIGEQVTQGQYSLKPIIVVKKIKSEKTLFYNKTTSGISNVSDTKGHNLIVPDSVSNIFWVTTFDDEYKSISYEIDLTGIDDKIILNTSVLAVGMGPVTYKKGVDYNLTHSGNTITLTFIDKEKTVSELTNNTMKQEITLYIPTQLSSLVPYNNGIGNYKDTYLGRTAQVTVTVKGRKRSIIQKVLDDGTIINTISYTDTPSEIKKNSDSIRVTFKEMPRIS